MSRRWARADLRQACDDRFAGHAGLVLQTALAGAVIAPCHSRAQARPNRPIRLVVPFPPGSSPGLIARLLSEPLAAALGQPVG